MRYPKIISESRPDDNSVILRFEISRGIVFFEGHFPSQPVLPGIVQVDWAIFFARKSFNLTEESCIEIEQIKFMKIIKPNTKLDLLLKLENGILNFKYYADDAVYSLGKLRI